jgi:GNAT superfamily N-acetyltransferase
VRDRDPAPARPLLEVRAEPADRPPARDLLEAMVAHILALYGPRGSRAQPTTTPGELGPPHGRLLVLYTDGRPVGCGGVKRLDDGVGEIKRMYVVPTERGRGYARLLLGALEEAARDLGYDRVRLDTGSRQPHARALYESAGYREISDYNGNPFAAHWFEKDLRAP